MRGFYYAALRNEKKQKEGHYHSKKLMKLDSARHKQIKDLFHKVSFNIASNFSLPVVTALLMKKEDIKELSEVRKILEVGAASAAAINHVYLNILISIIKIKWL